MCRRLFSCRMGAFSVPQGAEFWSPPPEAVEPSYGPAPSGPRCQDGGSLGQKQIWGPRKEDLAHPNLLIKHLKISRCLDL